MFLLSYLNRMSCFHPEAKQNLYPCNLTIKLHGYQTNQIDLYQQINDYTHITYLVSLYLELSSFYNFVPFNSIVNTHKIISRHQSHITTHDFFSLTQMCKGFKTSFLFLKLIFLPVLPCKVETAKCPKVECSGH